MLRRRLHEFYLTCDGEGCGREGQAALCEYDAFTTAMHSTPRIMSRWDGKRMVHLCDLCRSRSAPGSRRMLVSEVRSAKSEVRSEQPIDPSRCSTVVLREVTREKIREIVNCFVRVYSAQLNLHGSMTLAGFRALGFCDTREGEYVESVYFKAIDGSDVACTITATPKG